MKKSLIALTLFAAFAYPISDLFAQSTTGGGGSSSQVGQPGVSGNNMAGPAGTAPSNNQPPPNPGLQSLPGSAGNNPLDQIDANRDIRSDLRDNRQDLRQEIRRDRQDLRQDRQDMRQQTRQELRDNGERWRFVLHNGEWWYWMPDNYWMFYRDNNWNRYEADSFQPSGRYRAAYRGDSNGVYYDEFGRQYRRDYSPIRRAIRDGIQAVRGAQVDVNPGAGNTDISIDAKSGGTASGTGPNERR